MRDVVRRVSQSDEARAAGIELQPLLWEDLPPGQAQAGDLQSRVNALLDRYDLKRYEIYAGAMKDRLGTPTAKFRSGTIEELETAIAGHRRAQIPAEVLFYLIGPGSDEVRAFRDELTARGFLFSEVADREQLEARLAAHLLRIVTEWRLWRNRMRRGLRSARSAAAISAGILLLALLAAYLIFDRGGAIRVQDALRNGGAAAGLAAYEQEAPYLVAHQAFVKRELRDAMVEAIGRAVLEEGSARNAAVLWQRATRAGVWSADDADARRLLRRVAGRRLLESLLADGIDAGDVPQRCRAFEIEALREFAREAVASPALANWPPDQRIAACVLAEAWPQLSAIPGDDAKEAMVRFAPPDVEVYPFLLSFGPSATQQMLDALIQPVDGGKASADYEIAAYRAIAQRHDARAQGFLLRQYDGYATERVSYGFAQKAALIDEPITYASGNTLSILAAGNIQISDDIQNNGTGAIEPPPRPFLGMGIGFRLEPRTIRAPRIPVALRERT